MKKVNFKSNYSKALFSDKTVKKQRKLANLKPFKKGQCGNPNGRPKGSFSLTTLIKNKLAEIPVGERRSWAEIFVEKILHEALVNNNTAIQKEIWHYVDGMPPQSLNLENEKPIKTALVRFYKKNKYANFNR